MKHPSAVSSKLIPAVNKMGRHMMEYQGRDRVASNAVVPSRVTSVAVSKPKPNTTPTGYICHSFVMAFIHLPKNRYMSPRFCSCLSNSASSKSPCRIARKTLTIPTRMTMLSKAIKYRKDADTAVPNTPPNCSSPEPWCETAEYTVFSAMTTPAPMTTTMVE